MERPGYNAKTNTLFVATVDWCGTFKKLEKAPEFALNAHYYGGSVDPDPRDKAKGWLQAIDVGTGKVRWRNQWPTPLVAGVTVTSGNVLFTGDFNNDFLVIDKRATARRFTASIPAARSVAASSATRSAPSSTSRPRPGVVSDSSAAPAPRR